MFEFFNSLAIWLINSGIKVVSVLPAFIILSQMSKRIVEWREKAIPEKHPLQAAEAKNLTFVIKPLILHPN